MSEFYTATENTLKIDPIKGYYKRQFEVDYESDPKKYWEVIDRTTGEVVPTDNWSYDEESGCVVINNVAKFHEYTVSFLAYLIWDPVHMYNAITNDWKDFEHQITFDVRQPKTKEFTMKRLRKFIKDHPYVDVLRFTTFFHHVVKSAAIDTRNTAVVLLMA